MLKNKITVYASLAGIAATTLLVIDLNARVPESPPRVSPGAKATQQDLAASGIIESRRENVSISAPEPGLVTHVRFAVWDQVNEGDELFTLDDRELTAQSRVKGASIAVAEATLKRLRDQLARLKGVNDPRSVSADEVRTRENDVAVAEAELEVRRAELDQILVRIDRLTVRAPRDGTILQVNVRPGEYANPTSGSPPILLGETDQLQVRADIDEQNATRFQPGQDATAFAKGRADQPIHLRFLRIEPFVVPKKSLTGAGTERVDTRVLQVIYTFDRPSGHQLYTGQQVDLYIHPLSAKSAGTLDETQQAHNP